MNTYKEMVTHWRSVARPVSLHPRYQTMISPTMHIRNSFFETRLFRKVHVEYATAGKVEIVHQVAYPFPETHIPILGIDIMYVDGNVTMGILDLSLDQKDTSWNQMVNSLAEVHRVGGSPRPIPDWGQPIFSDQVVFLNAPRGFESFAVDVQHKYAQLACTAGLRDHHTFHTLYCQQQRQNTKTLGMLKHAFGDHVANEYLNVMFDL